MMGPTTLKEVRAQLWRRFGIRDKDLDAWMRRIATQRKDSGKPSEVELQSLLQQLEDAVAKAEKEPSQPGRKSPRAPRSGRQRTPKAS
jgi:hypothetical protein